jgi:hypothetical protein
MSEPCGDNGNNEGGIGIRRKDVGREIIEGRREGGRRMRKGEWMGGEDEENKEEV